MNRHTSWLLVFLLATRAVCGAPQEGGPILLKGNIQCQGNVILGGPGNSPHIVSLSPDSGPVGTAVTIFGVYFGASQGSSTVTLNGVALDSNHVTAWSTTSIGIVIPSGATPGWVLVVVTVGKLASNQGLFEVISGPSITGLSQIAGPVGTTVTLDGTGFGAAQGTSTVTLNGLAFGSQYVTSWSTASIGVVIPNGATTGNFVVTVGGIASNGAGFTVTNGSSPTITLVSPNGGPVGTIVTITGLNLGSSGTVTFNGVIAPSTSWNSTTIIAAVPNIQAGLAQINVTVGVNVSNPAPFTATSGPYISGLSLNTGPAGMGFMVNGSGFGESQGSSTVAIGGTTLGASYVVSWASQSITVQAPPTTPRGAVAVGGTVVVTVNNIPSSQNPQFSGTNPFGCGN